MNQWRCSDRHLLCSGVSGKYFKDCKVAVPNTKAAVDDYMAERLWKVSAELVGLSQEKIYCMFFTLIPSIIKKIPGWEKKIPSTEYVKLNLETLIRWVFINRTWIFSIHTGFSENHLNVSNDGNGKSNLEIYFQIRFKISIR